MSSSFKKVLSFNLEDGVIQEHEKDESGVNHMMTDLVRKCMEDIRLVLERNTELFELDSANDRMTVLASIASNLMFIAASMPLTGGASKEQILGFFEAIVNNIRIRLTAVADKKGDDE